MSQPSTTDSLALDRDSLLMIGAAVALLFVFLWSVLVAQQILAVVGITLWLFVVYLVWRFVRAHERLADAVEQVVTERDSAEEEEVDGGEHTIRYRESEDE